MGVSNQGREVTWDFLKGYLHTAHEKGQELKYNSEGGWCWSLD